VIYSFQNASYIPELARVDPNHWGVSLCTVDGQRYVWSYFIYSILKCVLLDPDMFIAKQD